MQLAIPLARCLPPYKGMRGLQAQVELFRRCRGFDRCMRKLDVSAAGPVPMDVVSELYAHWGDPPTQGGESYMQSCLAEAARARGPIVQCGASLMTLVLGSLCNASQNQANQLWCLEDDIHWANVVRSWLTQYRIGSAHVITSRAELFDSYVWYAVDTARLADRISLILCEGARATPRGVVGALQRLGQRLAPDWTILARKIAKADDIRQLTLWAKSHEAACVVVDRHEGFVKITRRTSIPAPAVPT